MDGHTFSLKQATVLPHASYRFVWLITCSIRAKGYKDDKCTEHSLQINIQKRSFHASDSGRLINREHLQADHQPKLSAKSQENHRFHHPGNYSNEDPQLRTRLGLKLMLTDERSVSKFRNKIPHQRPTCRGLEAKTRHHSTKQTVPFPRGFQHELRPSVGKRSCCKCILLTRVENVHFSRYRWGRGGWGGVFKKKFKVIFYQLDYLHDPKGRTCCMEKKMEGKIHFI